MADADDFRDPGGLVFDEVSFQLHLIIVIECIEFIFSNVS
jgi:hypothetical protein